jgi:hypothetical protein
MFYCSSLWRLLKNPPPAEFRTSIIKIITALDTYQTTYLSLGSLDTSKNFEQFSTPSKVSQPSVIDQVSLFEITVDPYIRALQQNYYYLLDPAPLSNYISMSSPNQVPNLPSKQHDDMVVEKDHITINPSTQQSPKNLQKKSVIIKDSLDVMMELIAEIQSTDQLDVIPSPSLTVASNPITTSSKMTIRFSLARKP